MKNYSFLAYCILIIGCGNNKHPENSAIGFNSEFINVSSIQDTSRINNKKKIIPTEYLSTKLNSRLKRHYTIEYIKANDKERLLANHDSIFYIKNINDFTKLKGFLNDSIYYLIYENIKQKGKVLLHASGRQHKINYFGEYGVELGDKFIWFFGTGGTDREWMIFDVSTGSHKATGDMYMGKCIHEGIVFFICDNSLLGYSATTDRIFKFIDFLQEKYKFARENPYWDFECNDRRLKIIYHGEYMGDSIRTFIADNSNW